MNFREFLLKEDPMGAPMGGGMGGDPMGGGMGGDPMGGGMGGDPMGGGGMETEMEPPPVPQYADVWDVLDAIINHKPIEQEKQKEREQQQKQATPPPADPMGGMGGDPMGGDPMGGDPMGGMGAPMPAGPSLMS